MTFWCCTKATLKIKIKKHLLQSLSDADKFYVKNEIFSG